MNYMNIQDIGKKINLKMKLTMYSNGKYYNDKIEG